MILVCWMNNLCRQRIIITCGFYIFVSWVFDDDNDQSTTCVVSYFQEDNGHKILLFPWHIVLVPMLNRDERWLVRGGHITTKIIIIMYIIIIILRTFSNGFFSIFFHFQFLLCEIFTHRDYPSITSNRFHRIARAIFSSNWVNMLL